MTEMKESYSGDCEELFLFCMLKLHKISLFYFFRKKNYLMSSSSELIVVSVMSMGEVAGGCSLQYRSGRDLPVAQWQSPNTCYLLQLLAPI